MPLDSSFTRRLQVVGTTFGLVLFAGLSTAVLSSAAMSTAAADSPAATATATATTVTTAATTAGTGAKLADKEKESAKVAAAAKNSRPVAGFTPEREAAALTFVRANHPELAGLLERLKDRRPHDYEKAVRDLFRVSERLALSREMFPVRYELELKQWKLTSRIQVLSARISMKRTPEQEQELKRLLAEQLEVRRELLDFNLEQAANRTQMLQRDLDDLDARKQEILDSKFEKAIKQADQRKAAGKPVGTAKKPPEKSGD